MKPARSRLPESQQQFLKIRTSAGVIDGAKRGHVYIDVFSFESENQIPSGTQMVIQYRITGTALWLTSRAIVLGCVPGTDPVVVQGRLVPAFPSESAATSQASRRTNLQ